MPEQLRNFFNPDNQPNPENQEEVPLANPENVPEISEKYKNLRCIETIHDDDHIWGDGYAMSQDFTTVFYKTGLGKTLKSYSRRSGNVQTVESEDMFAMDMKLTKGGQGISVIHGNKMEVYDAKTLKSKGVVESDFGYQTVIDQSPDLTKLAWNSMGSDVTVVDFQSKIETRVPNPEYPNPASALLCLRDSKTAALAFADKIKLLDLEEKQYTKESDKIESSLYGNITGMVESNDGKQIIAGLAGGEIRFFDKDNLTLLQEIKTNQSPISFIKESLDGAHVIVACGIVGGAGRVQVIHKETGQVVREVYGHRFHESSNGVLSVMNEEGIELWTWGVDKEATPNDVVIRGNKKLSDKERFEDFATKQGETVKGIHWNFYENLEAQRLSESKKVEWSDERIYFEVPLDELPKLKDLVVKAVKKAHIPVTFKYVDVEASSAEMVEKDVTRFVVNFLSVDDARKFYEILEEDKKYKSIQPDRTVDYLAHNIDGKAFYAQGFREIREHDKKQILNYLKNYTQNPDGSYSAPSSEGGVITMSKEEYERLGSGADIIGSLKKVWEKEKI